MKANPLRRIVPGIFLSALLFATGASSVRSIAQPTVPEISARSDWREADVTPGDWIWAVADGKSLARFANGELTMTCDTDSSTISILRKGSITNAVPITIETSQGTYFLNGQQPKAGELAAELVLDAHSPILDGMKFSRGHFAFETAGLPTLYVPSWPEIARVIEDCR